MSTVIKYGIFAGLLGILGYAIYKGSQKVSEWANQIGVAFSSFGLPVPTQGGIALPVNVVINSPVPADIPIDNVRIGLFILKNSMWVQFGVANTGPFQIATGDTPLKLLPIIDVTKLVPKIDSVQSVLNTLSTQGTLVQVKAITDITVQGFTASIETVQPISLKQILDAA